MRLEARRTLPQLHDKQQRAVPFLASAMMINRNAYMSVNTVRIAIVSSGRVWGWEGGVIAIVIAIVRILIELPVMQLRVLTVF